MDSSTETLRVRIAGRYAEPVSPEVIGGILRLSDLFVVGVVGIGVYFAYVYSSRSGIISSEYLASILVGIIVSGMLFQWLGVYAGDFVFAKWLRVDRAILAWGVTIFVLLFLAFALKITGFYSRVWTTTWFVATCGVIICVRFILSFWIHKLARQSRFALRTVILGADTQGQKLAEYLARLGDVRTHIVGVIDDRRTRIPAMVGGYHVLGDTKYLMQLIREGLVDQVLIALPWNADNRLRELIYEIAITPVSIRLAPDLIGFEFAGRSFVRTADLPMLRLLDRPISDWSHVWKTAEDRILGGTMLFFITPLMLLIALAIKVDSKGPVFFKQRRQGFNDSLFEVWKFRTMYAEANDPDCLVQITKNDSRITPVGRFLRKTSLDELPQFINVLRGDMSLVGPRPHAILTKANGRRFAEIVDRYAARHRVKPGITGWAQVNGWRGETDTVEKIQKRVEHDLYYIDHWSVWFDLWIIFKTIFVLFKDDNAY